MRRTGLYQAGCHHRLFLRVRYLILGTLLVCQPNISLGQSTPPITASGLNTKVSTPQTLATGQTQYNITGGTRPGGGTNLFHSFGNFNVPTNNIANFLNETALPTNNILGRVTGGNPSSIFGMIQTTGFGNANLFLMNPAGFLFGPNATVNVGGMVAFTTADYLRFQGSQTLFNNASTPESLSPLSIAPVAAFGFLGSNPAAIAVQGSTLEVAQGQSLTLVGGNQGFTATDPDTGNPIMVPGGVTMTGGSLFAPSGQINLASVASPGEILTGSLQPAPNINGQSFTSMGAITLTQGATLDVTDNAFAGDGHGGTIRIRGGQLIVDASFLTANTVGDADGAANAIVIDAQDEITLSNGSMITSSAFAGGRSGDITATTPTLTMADGSLIATASFGGGAAGNISLNAGSLNVMTNASIQSLAFADGRGGDIGVNAETVAIKEGGFISTGTFSSGAAGNINLNVGTLSLDAGQISTATGDSGAAGNITITATGEVSLLPDSGPSHITNLSNGAGVAGDISLQVGSLSVASNSSIDIITETGGATGSLRINSSGPITLSGTISDLGLGAAQNTVGSIEIKAPSMTLDNGFILTQYSGEIRGGDIVLQIGNLTMNGKSGIDSSTVGLGDAGNILVKTETFNMSGGATVTAETTAAGKAGNITIEGTASPAQSVLIDGAGSGIFTTTSGTGAGGNVFVNANTVTLQNGGTLSAATSGTAPSATGGAITVEGNTVQLNSAATITTATSGPGNAGDILVKADTFSMNGGATITAASTGSGNAGNVTIQGLASPAQSILIDGAGSGIFTDTQGEGAGGNINIAANSVTLSNGGTLSASTSGTEPTATGGTITVAATTVQLSTGASINAQTTGAGNAGAITITADDSVSLLSGATITSASVFSSGGSGGPVTITAPTVSLQQDSHITTAAYGFESDLFPGGAGDVTINASRSLTLMNSSIDSSANDTAGNAGNIFITTPSLSLSNVGPLSLSSISSGTFAGAGGLPTDGNAGSIELAVGQLSLAGSSLITSATTGGGQGGNITVHGVASPGSAASDVTITAGSTLATSATDIGSAGNITVNTAQLTLSGGGQMLASTVGPGSGGTITIRATEQVSIMGEALICPACPVGQRTRPSGLRATSGSDGNAGDILVETSSLTLTDGGRILAFTSGAGQGGTVTVQGLQGAGSSAASFTVNGQSSEGAVSGIFTDTQGTGAGGNIFVNANTVTLQNGGTLSAATSGTAASATGGTITVEGNTVQLNSAATITTATSGPGNAGDILVKADTFNMSGGATITAASTGAGNAGSVTIQGPASPAQSVLIDGANSGVFTTTDGTGAGGSITIESHQVQLSNSATISAKTTGSGNAGNILVKADSVIIESLAQLTSSSVIGDSGEIPTGNAGNITIEGLSSPAQSVLIDGGVISTETDGAGAGGNIFINASTVTLQNSAFINAQTLGLGNAGSVEITATERVALSDSTITSGSFSDAPGAGDAGQIILTSPIIELQSASTLATSAIGNGNAGAITLQTNRLTANNSDFTSSVFGQGQGGTITVRGLAGPGTSAQEITLSDNSTMLTVTSNMDPNLPGEGAAGSISLATGNLKLSGNSKISAETNFSRGHAGNIDVTAGNQITIDSNSEVSSRSIEGVDPAFQYGNAGKITLRAPTVTVTNGGFISTSTETNGAAGAIALNVGTLILSAGGNITSGSVRGPEGLTPTGPGGNVSIQGLASPAQSVLIDGTGSGIFTDTQGTGVGGNILVNANSVMLQNGGTLSATTSGTVPGATGGTITLTAPGQMAMTGGSSISASSSGPANAGDISINAGQQLTMQNSSITTEASQASGGNITIQAVELVGLATSKISASVLGGPQTTGGNITIDPNLVILQNSQITANAVQGNGGNISLTTNFLIVNNTLIGPTTPFPASAISASSQFGQNGTITVQSPNAPAGGKIIPLSQKPLLATSLLNQRCASLAGGEFSSFTVAGRDSLPTEPGGWLASPLAFGLAGTGGGTLAEKGGREGIDDDPARETPILSLRQIAPAGFLTQSFAVEGSAGCTS